MLPSAVCCHGAHVLVLPPTANHIPFIPPLTLPPCPPLPCHRHCLQPPNFQFHDPQGPIYTSPRFLPPAKVIKSKLTDAIVSHGAYLRECTINHAIIGLRSRIMEGVTIQVGGGGAGWGWVGVLLMRCQSAPAESVASFLLSADDSYPIPPTRLPLALPPAPRCRRCRRTRW